VWRRLLAVSETSIAELGEILQNAFGGSGEHLHRFLIRGAAYGIPHLGNVGFREDTRRVFVPRLLADAPGQPSVQHSLGHGSIHGGEKGLVVKRFIEIGDRPGPYRRVSHQVVAVPRHYDDACLGRNGLELLLDFEAAHN
jgi:Plasmid pRiA4b ORF-3-like protein